MDDVAQDVLREIIAAFPARREAAFDQIVNSIQGNEPTLTAAAFRDKKDWTTLEARWLDEAPDGWATALNFLSDEAICFYVPAYLAADLKLALERVDPTFNLVHGFDNISHNMPIWPRSSVTWTTYSTERWSRLTSSQARAVVHYLEWRVSRDTWGIEIGIAEALSSFWYRRANNP